MSLRTHNAPGTPASAVQSVLPRRPRSLAHELVTMLSDRIRDGSYPATDKLPTEAALMAEFGVSRTVVREAISQLQAAGLVETRHGIGTFVLGLGDGAAFRIAPDQLSTLNEVIAVLELRIGVETETAALAALRRTDDDLARMRSALDAFVAATDAGRDAVPRQRPHARIGQHLRAAVRRGVARADRIEIAGQPPEHAYRPQVRDRDIGRARAAFHRPALPT